MFCNNLQGKRIYIYICMKWSEVTQSCLTLCDLMDCSPLSSSVIGFSRQEYWSGLPFPSLGHLPDPGIEPGSPALQADALPSEPPGKSFPLCYTQFWWCDDWHAGRGNLAFIMDWFLVAILWSLRWHRLFACPIPCHIMLCSQVPLMLHVDIFDLARCMPHQLSIFQFNAFL